MSFRKMKNVDIVQPLNPEGAEGFITKITCATLQYRSGDKIVSETPQDVKYTDLYALLAFPVAGVFVDKYTKEAVVFSEVLARNAELTFECETSLAIKSHEGDDCLLAAHLNVAVAAGATEGMESSIDGLFKQAVLAKRRELKWRNMTAHARTVQLRHLGEHDGDVYHAMQSVAVRNGYRPDKLKIVSRGVKAKG